MGGPALAAIVRNRRVCFLHERSPDGFAIDGINLELRIVLTSGDGLRIDSPRRPPGTNVVIGDLYQEMQRTRIATRLAWNIIVLVQGVHLTIAVRGQGQPPQIALSCQCSLSTLVGLYVPYTALSPVGLHRSVCPFWYMTFALPNVRSHDNR